MHEARKQIREKRCIRPFRGPTNKKVFQTVDIGPGKPEWLLKQASKFPNRQYMAVDPIYNRRFVGNNSFSMTDGDEYRRQLKRPNITIRGEEFSKTISFMKNGGYKARHFNLDMPFLKIGKNKVEKAYGINRLFENVDHVLMPNGKIHITSEDRDTLERIKQLAQAHGLKTKPIRKYPIFNPRNLRTTYMRDIAQTRVLSLRHPVETASKEIKRLEITFGLKKAGKNKPT